MVKLPFRDLTFVRFYLGCHGCVNVDEGTCSTVLESLILPEMEVMVFMLRGSNGILSHLKSTE